MRTSARTIVAIALLCAACAETAVGPEEGKLPGAPTPASPPAPPPPPATTVTSSCPTVPGPGRAFNFASQLGYAVSSYTTQSRFVLYDDGKFALQFSSAIGQYCGRYTESNGRITFEWDGWSRAGAWGATGIVEDRTMTVTYNIIMLMTDFEDAIYTRKP